MVGCFPGMVGCFRLLAAGLAEAGERMCGRTTFVSLLVVVGGCLEGPGHWESVFVTDRLNPPEVAEAAAMVRGNLTRTEYILNKPFLCEVDLVRDFITAIEKGTKTASFSPVDRASWSWEKVSKYGLPS